MFDSYTSQKGQCLQYIIAAARVNMMTDIADTNSKDNEDFYDEDEVDFDQDEDLEDNSMDIDLEEKPDVKSLKVTLSPPSSAYNLSEDKIMMKLSGNCSMEEVEKYKERLKDEHCWIQCQDLPAGWLFKQFGSDMKLLGRGGEIFENMNEAFEFVEKYYLLFGHQPSPYLSIYHCHDYFQ